MKLDFDAITTRGGDEGKTTLYGGERRYKYDLIFEVLGNLDETTSTLGLGRSKINMVLREKESVGNFTLRQKYQTVVDELLKIQQTIQDVAGIIAVPTVQKEKQTEKQKEKLRPGNKSMDQWEDELTERLEILEAWEKDYLDQIEINGFILPGDYPISASLDLARAVTRRTERSIVKFIQSQPIAIYKNIQNYLNRLSDYLFVLARFMEQNIENI